MTFRFQDALEDSMSQWLMCLAIRLFCVFTLLYINVCLHLKGTCGLLLAIYFTHSPHEGVVMVVVFPTTLLVYLSAIFPQRMAFKYGRGGRLVLRLLRCWVSRYLNSIESAKMTDSGVRLPFKGHYFMAWVTMRCAAYMV